jgi:DNA-directed RNA polymerase specialized sigma24 family protein
VVLVADDSSATVIAIHDALTRLAVVSPRSARIVELRFFGGLNEKEAAEVTSVSIETVRLEWRAAKAWLYNLMAGSA